MTKPNDMNNKTMLGSQLVPGVLAAGCELESHHKSHHSKLESEARITKADARQTALARDPEGAVKEAELETTANWSGLLILLLQADCE